MKNKIINRFNFIIYWIIILMPFSIAIAPGMIYTFFGIMAFSFLAKKSLKRERVFIKTCVNLPFIFLILAALLSFKNTTNLPDSIHGVAKIIVTGLTFLICAEEIKDRDHIKKIIYGIIFSASLIGLDAIVQLATGRDFIHGYQLKYAIGIARVTASFPNSNILGIYITSITAVIVVLALFLRQTNIKRLCILGAVLGSIGVLLTFSRGAGIGLYLGILLISVIRKNKILISGLVILPLIFAILMPKNIKEWAKEIHYNPMVFMWNYDRISIYKNALNMIAHHPVIGVGVNTFCRNYLTYKLPEPENAKSADSVYAHNNFLQMAGEIGLLGLAAFFWFLYRLFKNAYLVYKKLDDEFCKMVSLSIIASLTAFLINGMTETSLYYSRISMIFWYFAGFSLALNKFSHAERA